MTLDFLKDKKIAVLGMGVNNRELTRYLKDKGVNPVILDWKHVDDLVGKLDEFDVIFRTPGFPYLSKAIQQAKNNGALIHSQTKLFFELCPCPIIGVTGTKGKGTTSSLITKILIDAGKTVYLGGNIGRDPFEFIENIKPSDFVVLELSSFQLQDLEQSPHIAVVLNITSDHLDHHQTVEEYRDAKTSLVRYQKEKDFAVLCDLLPEEFTRLGAGQKIIFKKEDGEKYESRLLGSHNFYNIAAASKVGRILEIPEVSMEKSIAQFEGLPHRLKVVADKDGIKYIDDSFSTNIDTTIAAINSFTSPLVLILGGSDKGLDYTELGSKIKNSPHVKGLVVIGNVAHKILDSINGFGGKVLTGANNIREILDQAESLAERGDIILLSPAAASFGLFKDYKDRGNQFMKEALS